MADNKLHIRLHVYDTDISVNIIREEEEYYRNAAKLITDTVNTYASVFKGRKSDKELLYMALIDIALRYEKENCRCFGGDLYALGDGIAAASIDEGETLIRELLCPEGADRLALAAALGAKLGTQRVLLLSSAPEGRPYLASDTPLPPGCVWNLTLD